MSHSISIFFDAWQIEDTAVRLDKITSAVAKDIQYDDPRTAATIKGIAALNDYVGMFSANAPGWSATVVNEDAVGNVIRATVAFSGADSDGVEQVQLGQYFVEEQGGLIVRMVGFAGMGEQKC